MPPDARKSLALSTGQIEKEKIALEAQNARLQAIIRTLPASLLLIQRSGIVLCVKSEADLSFNPLDDTSATLKVEDYFSLAFAQQLMQECFQTELTPLNKTFEYERIANGAKQIFELRIIAESQDEIIGVERVVTEQKQIETLLRQSEQRYRTLVELCPDAIFIIQSSAVTYANPAGLHLLGATHLQQLLEQPGFSFAHPTYQQAKQEHRERLLQEGDSIPLSKQKVVRLDGAVVDVEVVGSAFLNQEGVAKQFVLRDITARKRAEEENAQLLARLEKQHIQLQALYRKYADAQEDERKRLAAELHDHIGQNLTILGFNLDLIRTQLSGNRAVPDYIHARLDESTALIEQTTELVRDVLADLRPVVLEHYGFLTALKGYIAEMRRRTGLPVNLHSDSDFPRLPELTELGLFRIVQEVFTNTIKHAQATQISVSLTVEANSVRLMIADNGRGFDIQRLQEAPKSQSWGLLTMQERAAAIGGSIRIVSYPGQGTHITVEAPR